MPKNKTKNDYQNLKSLIVILVVYAAAAVAIDMNFHSKPAPVCLGLVGIAASWIISKQLALKPLHNFIDWITSRGKNQHSLFPADNNHQLIDQLAREYNRLNAEILRKANKAQSTEGRIKQSIWDQTNTLRVELKQLKKHALTDDLTGLANRGHLDEYSKILFKRAQSGKEDLACIMVDIDNFKTVNDTFGHAIGDEVIIFTGQVLHSCTRQNDFCARYGGDEFFILLPDCSKKIAMKICERIRGHFAREVRT